MGESRVHKALEALVTRLDELDIPYAILGALALNAYGYLRATVDVDVLMTREGLERFRSASLGRGYLEKFPGSRGVRDTERNVDIDVVLAGDFPGDGREKPVAFPDPATSAVTRRRFQVGLSRNPDRAEDPLGHDGAAPTEGSRRRHRADPSQRTARQLPGAAPPLRARSLRRALAGGPGPRVAIVRLRLASSSSTRSPLRSRCFFF